MLSNNDQRRIINEIERLEQKLKDARTVPERDYLTEKLKELNASL